MAIVAKLTREAVGNSIAIAYEKYSDTGPSHATGDMSTRLMW